MQVLCLIIGKRALEDSNPKRERDLADKKVSDSFLSSQGFSTCSGYSDVSATNLSASAASIAFTGQCRKKRSSFVTSASA